MIPSLTNSLYQQTIKHAQIQYIKYATSKQISDKHC